MNILSLNTAFSEAHIALQFNGKKYFRCVDSKSKHSENLLPSIEKLFYEIIKKEKLKFSTSDFLKEIDVISCVVGPGSFTGLRIALSTVKAFLTVFPNIKTVQINTLELLAYEYWKVDNNLQHITPIVDALSGFYFIAEYKNLSCITPPKMITKEELNNYKNLISNDYSIAEKVITLTPETLLDITLQKILQNEFVDENNLVPLYLRPSQAEAERQCKLKK